MPTAWKTPYDNLDKAKRFTLCVDVDIDDHRLIKSITVTHGTISKFIQTLYHDIAEYARANNLTIVDSDGFIDYLRQRADSQLALGAGARDGRGNTTGVHQDPPRGTDESPSVPKASKGGRGNGKTARK